MSPSRVLEEGLRFTVCYLLFPIFCSSSALADTFGLGTAGPGNWGVLETSTGQVTMSNGSNIGVGPGGGTGAANLGINSGGKLQQSGTVVVQGKYYKFSTNSDTTTNGFTAVGGVITTSNSVITSAASAATSASTNLAGLTANQTFGTLSANTTINATVGGRNVISLAGQNLSGITLTLNGSASQSFVINVSGAGITLGAVQLIGGLTAANVIFNVTGGNTSVTNGVTVNGILMDINGTVTLSGNDTLNGEIISGKNISLSGGSDVEVVLPEASTAAYFTLGPLILVAVMLLHRCFSRRKQALARGPVEGVLDAVDSS
ncbi:MAG: hypothetical protein C5B58_09760 [Acidobacteria bacterium]|nr:MAG: hypothetical protein C5B58_09760 [Acidobacteriota bacterium]